MRNISMDGVQFYKVFTAQKAGQGPPVIDDAWFSHNHFIDTYTSGALVLGTNATVGNPYFADASGGDYVPLPNSPLRLRLSDSATPVDVNGEERSTPDTVGAIR
mmetsp:Transcript_78155/g.158764  ORF Transcript_78155/g.158764 Transcript_78155/m.158764 type:complete len:104 (-) Transcript_78155:317-628(-)